MSQENVEIAQQSLEAFGRRDVEAMRGLNDPDVVLDWSASAGVEAEVYRGFDAALRFYTGYFEVFEELVFEEMHSQEVTPSLNHCAHAFHGPSIRPVVDDQLNVGMCPLGRTEVATLPRRIDRAHQT
jgi:ketosteroid isomerase-like protein